MGAGPELQELKAIDHEVVAAIHFGNQVRDFAQERLTMEAEYAEKLLALHAKTSQAGLPKTRHTNTSQSAFANTGDGSEYRTLEAAWLALLNDLEASAKNHRSFSEAIHSGVVGLLEGLEKNNEDGRRKNAAFYTRLLSERDRIVTEAHKAKSKFDASCEALEAVKTKQLRAPDERTAEKLSHKLKEDSVDRVNAKTSHALALASANAVQDRFYKDDLPSLMDANRNLLEDSLEGVTKAWKNFLECSAQLAANSDVSLADARNQVDRVDVSSDVALFMGTRGGWREMLESEAATMKLTPPIYLDETNDLSREESSIIFLKNKLRKLRKRVEQLNTDIELKENMILGMETLEAAYRQDPAQGDARAVRETILAETRELVVVRIAKTKFQTQIDLILKEIRKDKSLI
ncbi:hypothetical protein HKX48_004120 [Thoreauomyces humboldtii]|nr:hypothetical protein HKX48_004120 [Thoreauomyces humboldtii]